MLDREKTERTIAQEKLMITLTVVGIISSLLAACVHIVTLKKTM